MSVVKYEHIDKAVKLMLTIKSLSTETRNDYLRFFDKDAFVDHPDWDGCYCTFNHFGKNELDAFEASIYDSSYTRMMASKFVESGILKGYLAYENEKVIGWMSSNDKKNYVRLFHDQDVTTDEDDQVKSIACFVISPQYRQQGVATTLLHYAISEAKKEGFTYIEAYPDTGHNDCFMNYHGYKLMFEREGFYVYKTLEKCAIMRKKL